MKLDTINRALAVVFIMGVAFVFASPVAEAETSTLKACLRICDKLPVSDSGQTCCENRCFCAHPPDYMSPGEKREACDDARKICSMKK